MAKGQQSPRPPWKETAWFPKCRSFQDRARAHEQEEGKRRQRNPNISLPLRSQQLEPPRRGGGGQEGWAPPVYFK